MELLDDKFQSYLKSSTENKHYFTFLLPLYQDNTNDLASYGFIGINGIKLILIKDYKPKEPENKAKTLLESIHTKYSNIIQNPFYNKALFNKDTTSSLKTKFLNEVFSLLNNK